MADVFTDLARDLESDLPRCPRPAIIKALADAWRNLCRRALVWRHTEYLNRVAGTARYEVVIPFNADLVQVDRVRMRTEAQVTAKHPGDAMSIEYYRVERTTDGRIMLTFDPAPVDSVASGIGVTLCLSPKRNETNVEDPDLFIRYEAGVIGGALYELAGKPRRPWSSPTLARQGMTAFNNAISQGLADRVKRYKPGFGLVTES
jgi:hypothetical protein